MREREDHVEETWRKEKKTALEFPWHFLLVFLAKL
jgi:hypothetical protein